MNDEKPITQSELDMVARLNAERFTGDDLLEISEAVSDLPEDKRDWQGRLFLVAKHFRGHHYRGLAVDYRLTAMCELITSNTLPFGVLPEAPDGSHQVADCVFEAAAHEPILFRGNKPYFDPESFKRRALEFAEADGKA